MAGETTELKIPWPAESDEANQGATKIKELAERVDLLLRKQLTKTVEIAKLVVTETPTFPGGPWTALSGLNAKLSEEPGVTGVQSTRARTESGGAVARLRGGVEVKSPEEFLAGETLFTLPVGLRPPGVCFLPAMLNTAGVLTYPKMQVTSAGVCSLSALMKSNAVLTFDGLTFNLS